MSQPSSPSHRNPLTLLSKLKRQLSKSPIADHGKQPIEHQYLPIPTLSFAESDRALSTYSCSNHSSSASSFVLINHNEQPESSAVDDYRPFLPLIIQHERLQQRLSPPPPRRVQRTRVITPPPPTRNESPSPTSSASSKSPVTPIFTSSFFDEEEDGIMTLSSSEVGSISEYSLPRSLSAYIQARNQRGRKSTYQTSSDSESRHGRVRAMSFRTPPPRTRKSFPPISPPPSCPLPEPPVYPKAAPRPNTPLVMSDSESVSSHLTSVLNRGLHDELTAPPSPPLALSPAIRLVTKANAKARPESTSTSILSELEIFDSASTYATAASTTSSTHSDQPQDQNEDDDDDESVDVFTARTSPSSPTSSPPTTPTPRQYGMGRQVIRGSGTGRDFGFDFGSDPSRRNSKRLSAKRDSARMEKNEETRLLVGPESTATDGNAEPLAANEALDVEVAHPTPTRVQTPPPPVPQRRRVRSDDTNPTVDVSVSRQTTHREKSRKKVQPDPEWTLFLGIPRNAPPPPPPVLPSTFTGEPNVTVPKLASTATTAPSATIKNLQPSFLPTHFPLPPTMSLRNRTKSDSALLASANASASSSGGGADTKSKTQTKVLEGEDWTLSLPLVVSPTSHLSSASSATPEVPKGSLSNALSKSESVQREAVREEEGLVITVEDVDNGRRQGKEKRRVRVRPSEEYENHDRDDQEEEEDQESLVFRVPRIVRSCPVFSSSSPLSTDTALNNMHGRIKKSSTNHQVSSCTLEEEVMFMLLGGDDDEARARSRSSSLSSTTKTDQLASAMDLLARKKMATLDEDLARFNALLRNSSCLCETAGRPASMVIENAVAAAATATATATMMTKTTKTVTLNSHPESIPTPTVTTTTIPSSTSTSTSPIKKKKSTLKPALKHAKSCEPFLLESSWVHDPFPLPPPPPSMPSNMDPVMRFPSSTGRGDLNFFDELGGGDDRIGSNRVSLRLTRSAEWVMGELDGDGFESTISSMSDSMPVSARASPPPMPPQQHRSTRSNSPSTMSTHQTLLLPFASSNLSSLKTKGSLGGFEKAVVRRPAVPFGRALSMGSLSRTTPTTRESSLGLIASTSHKEKQYHQQHQKRSSPNRLRLHASSLSSSSSSASSSIIPASSSQPQPQTQRHAADAATASGSTSKSDTTTNNRRRRSVSPPPLSPIPSESSSVLHTPLASAFPLPPSSPRITVSGLSGGVVAFQKKLKEVENAREEQQQQRRRREGSEYLGYKPPSTASSVNSLVSNASSTATVVPGGDQKMNMRTAVGSSSDDGGRVSTTVQGGGREREREETGDVQEDDDDEEDSTYYSARSSFSPERVEF